MAPPAPAAAPTVLVVDDKERVRESMRRVLRGTCRVLEAGDAATALERT
jgi:CheY-like chemotaxis protein